MTTPRSPLILAYHGVGDVPLTRDWYRLFVRPEDLRRHVVRLRGWGYRLVAFGALAAAVRTGDGRGLAALTFDDGLADNATVLAPLLTELNAPATAFVVSGRLGAEHQAAPWARMMTAHQVREVHAAGLEIGAHTVTHPDLTTLDYEGARAELETSRKQLEDLVQDAVSVAAYPYGNANATVVEACRDAGFVAACTTAGRGSWADPLNLPRQDVGNRQAALGFYLKRDDRYERMMRPITPVLLSKPGRVAIKVIRHVRSLGSRG